MFFANVKVLQDLISYIKMPHDSQKSNSNRLTSTNQRLCAKNNNFIIDFVVDMRQSCQTTCHHGQSTPRWCLEAARPHHPTSLPPSFLTPSLINLFLGQFSMPCFWSHRWLDSLTHWLFVPRVLISPAADLGYKGGQWRSLSAFLQLPYLSPELAFTATTKFVVLLSFFALWFLNIFNHIWIL